MVTHQLNLVPVDGYMHTRSLTHPHAVAEGFFSVNYFEVIK